jgi:hypothetical protein
MGGEAITGFAAPSRLVCLYNTQPDTRYKTVSSGKSKIEFSSLKRTIS